MRKSRQVIDSMSNCTVRGMVFDMDGVLIDSHSVHRRAWRNFLNSIGRRTTEKELDFILDGRKREEILRYLLGDLPPDQIEEYGILKDKMLQEIGDEVQSIPGVIEFLEDLSEAGIRMAVATSASRRRVESTLMALDLGRFFQTIVTGDDVDAGKPDPAIYRLASARLHEAPGNLLAVEDAVSGVKSATAAGIKCIGVANALRSELLRAAGADPVIPDFRGLSFEQLETKFARDCQKP